MAFSADFKAPFFLVVHIIALLQAAWQIKENANALLSYQASILQYPKENLPGLVMLLEAASQLLVMTANASFFLLLSLNATQAHTSFHENPKQGN